MKQFQIADLCVTTVSNNFKHVTAVGASTVCTLQQYILEWVNVGDCKGYQGKRYARGNKPKGYFLKEFVNKGKLCDWGENVRKINITYF